MMKNQTKNFIFIAVIAIIFLGAIFTILYVQKNISEKTAEVDLIAEPVVDLPCEKTRKIDGVCFEGEEPGLFAVMIDNHSWARPPAGLGQASLVYETVVETPITRFLAFFTTDLNLSKIGPVRSARPFYVDWVKEFNVPYVHVGGSNEALEILNATYKYDLNEFSNGQYFWRDSNRSAPHNTFTSVKQLMNAAEQKGWSLDNTFDSWAFKPEAIEENRGEYSELFIEFGNYQSKVRWVYHPDNNQYTRYQAGEAHMDSNGDPINAKNLALMYTTGSVIDDYGRRQTVTTGQGKAVVFQDGQYIEGDWSRNNLNERTRFYDNEGNEIKFNAGLTWIEVIQTDISSAVFYDSDDNEIKFNYEQL